MAIGDKKAVLMETEKGAENGVSALDNNRQVLYAMNKNLGVVQESNLLVWASAQNNAGGFTVDPSITREGVPEIVWMFGMLEIVSGGRVMTVKTSAGGAPKMYINVYSSGAWQGWDQVYTAAHLTELRDALKAIWNT